MNACIEVFEKVETCVATSTEFSPGLFGGVKTFYYLRFLVDKSRNIRAKLRIWGAGVWGTIFIVNMFTRIAPKLRTIILLRFRLRTFRIQYWRTPKPNIFKVLEPSGRDHDPQNQYYLSLETPGALNT